MSETIREQIIQAIEDKLKIVIKDKAYQTDSGKNVFRAIRNIDENIDEFLNIFPKPETAVRDSELEVTMPVNIEGIAKFISSDNPPQIENPSQVAEKLLGDIIEAMVGRKWILDFTSGGSYQPRPANIITGATSGATGFIESVSLESGDWENGDAAGKITIRRKKGNFTSENLNIGDETNVATIDGTVEYQSAEYSTTGDLATDIIYLSGGAEEYPEEGQNRIGVLAIFNVVYSIIADDPFSKP